MTFDVQRLFEDYQIQHWTSGKNVAQGFINVRCPFCDDRSNHGGFGQNGHIYLCWRCGRHSVEETLGLLLGMDRNSIISILNKYKTYIDIVQEEYESNVTSIQLPGSKMRDGHRAYLKNRGFDSEFLENKYQLKGTLARSDALGYRIVIPVLKNNQPISYQARDYTGTQEPKYINCKKELEVFPMKKWLFNLDNCNSERVLVFEGPFDVFRFGNDTVATLGVGYTTSQLALLATRFDQVFVMFDSDDAGQERAKTLTNALSVIGKKTTNLVLDVGDPAEQTEDDVAYIKKDLKI